MPSSSASAGPGWRRPGRRCSIRSSSWRSCGSGASCSTCTSSWRWPRGPTATSATSRPDAVVLIDYPGFHWWIAWRAKVHGIPVFYYVPPQIWAWAGWRVKKVRKYVDHVLCSLPFEPPWYHARGVPGAVYVGHPYFDELAERTLDEAFLAEERARGGRSWRSCPARGRRR